MFFIVHTSSFIWTSNKTLVQEKNFRVDSYQVEQSWKRNHAQRTQHFLPAVSVNTSHGCHFFIPCLLLPTWYNETTTTKFQFKLTQIYNSRQQINAESSISFDLVYVVVRIAIWQPTSFETPSDLTALHYNIASIAENRIE